MKLFSNLNKRCKLIVWECAILLLFFVVCTIQDCVEDKEFRIMFNSSFIIYIFFISSVLQFVFAWKDSVWRKIANTVCVVVKILIILWLYFVTIHWMWHESHWTPEDWAQIGNFGTTIWGFLLSICTSMVVGVFLVGDLVLVGVDVVWMIKKLAKHIQAKKQKA